MKRVAVVLSMAAVWTSGRALAQTDEEDRQLREHIRRAQQYKAEGKRKQHAEQLALALPLIESILGASNDQTLAMMSDLANLYSDLSLYAQAEPLYRRCLALRESVSGRDDPKTAIALNNLALLLDNRGQHVQAEPFFLRALAICEAKRDEDDPQTATVLDNLASLYVHQAQYAKAEPLARRGLAMRERRQGPNHPDTAISLNNLALLHMNQGRYAKAEPLLDRCVRICEEKLGKQHHKTATALDNLAGLRNKQARYADAEQLYRRSLEIRETSLGKDHASTAFSLGNLGECYRCQGEYAKAEPLLKRSLEVFEVSLGRDHPETARTLDNLGVLYHVQGHYARAEPLYRRALKIREEKLGKDHPDTARSLNNLASLQNTQGQHALAEPMYRRALEICEVRLGKDHPETARAIDNLAALYHQGQQFSRAEPLYQRALEIRERQLGKDHPDLTAILNNLAHLSNSLGDFAKAEALYRRCLTICETSLGKDHPTTAVVLNNLAAAHQDQGQLDQAEALFRRSLDIHERKLDKDHPKTAYALHNLAALNVRTKSWTEALKHTDQARRILTRHTAATLPVLSEPEQLLFLDKMERLFNSAFSLGLLRRNDPRAAEMSASWLLNGRAASHQALAEQYLLARTAATPASRALLDELTRTRQAWAALLHRPAGPDDQQASDKRRRELRQLERDLTGKLAREIGRPYRDDPWVELAEVRKNLPAHAVLIDIVRVSIYDFDKERSQPPHYLAWITPPADKGSVHVIDLGDAGSIERAIMVARRSIVESAAKIRERGEPEVAEAIKKPLEELSKLVVRPLLSAAGDSKEWIVCPDGALWLAPWNALPLPDSKHVVESYQLRFVISGRDLVAGKSESKANVACLFADPDFDLGPSEVRAETDGLVRGGTPLPPLAGRLLKGSIGDWNVSFEFKKQGNLLIRDEDAGGEVAGTGRWSQARDRLVMETSQARFEGLLRRSMISGERKIGDQVDRWQLRLPTEAIEDHPRATVSSEQLIPRAARLPGTAAELELVAPKIKALLNQEPRIYSGAQAGEAVVKTVEQPRILMLSTHGYFLSDQEAEPKGKDRLIEFAGEQRSTPLVSKNGERIENPFLRCGLLLAGCNKRNQAKPGDEDGILTGLEILGLDLRGTELVVLSACETGIGEVRNGEGVAGLRQAFMLAGAESVLASLWQVSDRETALLMSAFFTNLSKGQSRAEALRNAQLERIESRRRQFGAAHPFYWAAFNITGR